MQACPVHINIPRFIKAITTGDFKSAYYLIRKSNPFPNTCALVCPVEKLCEGNCVLGTGAGKPVSIAKLQQFVVEKYKYPWEINVTAPKTYKVGIIGAGPAGLAASERLLEAGIRVSVFDAKVEGGMMKLTIPAFRLPVNVVEEEIKELKTLGVSINSGVYIGEDIEKLLDSFDALLITVGLSGSRKLGIEGEEAKGVFVAEEFLARIKKGERLQLGDTVVVVGGGNTAMDSACVSKELGVRRVTVIYRRTWNEMPAWERERIEAIKAGVEFIFLASPKKFILDRKGKLKEILCQEYTLGENDSSGRRRPEPLEGKEFCISATTCVLALGQVLEFKPYFGDLYVNIERGVIKVDEQFMTSIPGVFAAGDAVNGGRTVVEAIAEGQKAGDFIIKYLESKKGGASGE